ncbi:MAG: sigma 54-interacting transcriptional regulator [Polyangiaceae bacterium]
MTTVVGTGAYVEAVGGTLSRLDRPGSPPVEIPSDPLLIGRDPTCGLAVDVSTVSWAHAEATVTPKGVRVRDLDSKNGTFVGVEGVRVVEVYLVKPTRIWFGDAVFQFTPGGKPVQIEAPPMIEAFGPIIGATPVMRKLFARLAKFAATDMTALIMGLTGTGKELVARAIHDASKRARCPYEVIDCSSLPASLAESTLFGHERGAFTDAKTARPSPFEEAEGGTVFLDEVGELPIELQPKLLRVLEAREIRPVGSKGFRKVNVRIIAATRRDLRREMNTSSFRSDLYFRLAELQPIEVPSLRERAEDIPMLLAHFARQLNAPGFERRIPDASLERLLRYDWPGNVRELRSLVASAIAFSDPGEVRIEEYISSSAPEPPSIPSPKAEAQKAYWTELWTSCGRNISKISRQSGKARQTVRKHLAMHGLSSEDE